MKTANRFVAFSLLLVSAVAGIAQTVPALVNYQGRLANPDGTPLPTGDYTLTFRVFASATNTSTAATNFIWGPQVFDGVNAQGHGGKIPVVQGYFNVMLGPVDTNGLSFADAFNATNRYVEITVGTNSAILPRQQILSAPYALNSAKLAGADWSAVFGTNDPANGKIPTSKLATNGTIIAQQIGVGTSNPQGTLDVNGTLVLGHDPNTALWSSSGWLGLKADPGISLNFSHGGGGILDLIHNPNDNGLALQCYNQSHTGSAAYLGIGGYSGQGLPLMQLWATNLLINSIIPSGKLSVGCGADFSGNVGIGTAAPGERLRLQGPSAAATILALMNSAGSTRLRFDYNNTVTAIGTDGNTRLDLGATSFTGNAAIPSALTLNTNGNVGIGKINPATALDVSGTVTATAFNPPSDRNLKEHFTPIRPEEVLAKVAVLPITRWNFIGDDATPHLGPMAQDFHAAFGLGTDERHIATVDADGVALAAIQGLNQKLEQLLKAKDQEIEMLKQRLVRLENSAAH